MKIKLRLSLILSFLTVYSIYKSGLLSNKTRTRNHNFSSSSTILKKPIIKHGFHFNYLMDPTDQLFLIRLQELTKQNLDLNICLEKKAFYKRNLGFVCTDLLNMNDPLIIYSVGSNKDKSFELSIAKKFTNSNIFIFDNINEWQTLEIYPQIHFYPISLIGENTETEQTKEIKKSKTLAEITSIKNNLRNA